jgi:hypothetical protein
LHWFVVPNCTVKLAAASQEGDTVGAPHAHVHVDAGAVGFVIQSIGAPQPEGHAGCMSPSNTTGFHPAGIGGTHVHESPESFVLVSASGAAPSPTTSASGGTS